MWTLGARSERRIRLISGGLVLGVAVLFPIFSRGSISYANAGRWSTQVAQALIPGQSRVLPIAEKDLAALGNVDGAAVYRVSADGRGEIIGRVQRSGERFVVLLSSEDAGKYGPNGMLLYAHPVRTLDKALELLLAPEDIEGELKLAEAALRPMIERELLPPLSAKFRAELRTLFSEFLNDQGEGGLRPIAEQMAADLGPETEMLIDRLVTRAWQEIGIWGVAVGLARKVGESAEEAWQRARDYIKGVLGHDVGGADSASVPFLTDERRQALTLAMHEELSLFWQEQGAGILRKAGATIERNEEAIVQKLGREWLPRVYENVVRATLREKRDAIVEGLTSYGTSFANRRLLVDESGAPRLTFAYSLRTVARITKTPLFVIAEGAGAENATPGELRLIPYAEGIALLRR